MLLRHGRAHFHGRFLGSKNDQDLSDDGLKDADVAGDLLRQHLQQGTTIDMAFASALKRGSHTAQRVLTRRRSDVSRKLVGCASSCEACEFWLFAGLDAMWSCSVPGS